MIHSEGICPDCSGTTDVKIGQTITHDGQLRWYQSTICRECDYTTEEDDGGLPPDDIREAIMTVDGVWAVEILAGADRVTALRSLRLYLGISVSETVNMKDHVPGIVAVGTRTEAKHLCKTLIQNRIPTKMKQV